MERSNGKVFSISRAFAVPAGLGLLGLLVALGGCGNGSGASSTVQAPVAESLSGVVMGGRQPVAGATVKFWGAGLSGAGPTHLATVTTNQNGGFTGVTFSPTPAPGQIVYAVASGGDAGSGMNSAIRLASVLGPYCSGNGCNFPDFVNINELSTVAMAYSLEGYTDLSGGIVGISGPTAGPGLANAVATFANLVNNRGGSVFLKGTDCTGSGEPDNCYALEKLNTLADITAACVNSNGPASTACGGLFDATSPAEDDTFSALFSIVTEASVRNDSTGIFNLLPSGQQIYSPALSATPNDWTLSLVYGGGGLCFSEGIAIDAQGNVWVANYLPWDKGQTPHGHISEFSPIGAAISPNSGANCNTSGGFQGGGLQGPVNLAIDASGNVWVANWNGGDGTEVSEFNSSGVPVSANGHKISGISPGPYVIAISPDGTIWVLDNGNASITSLDPNGTEIAQYHGGGIAYPLGIGIDALGNVWTANYGSNSVAEFSPSAATWISPAHGYTGGGLQYSPQSLALDANGNVWVPEFYSSNYPADGSVMSELVGGDTPPASCPANPGPGDTGCPLSPADGFTGGGLFAPDIVAIDSAGHLFVSNFHGNSLTELNVADGSALSPTGLTGGYRNPVINQPEGVAIDASGNVWMATNSSVNKGPSKLLKFIGLAAPVKTPMLGGLPTAP